MAMAAVPIYLSVLMLLIGSTEGAAAALRRPAPKASSAERVPEWMSAPLFHSPRVFAADYAEMKQKLKVFVYPHPANDSSGKFGHEQSRDAHFPYGSYASEPFLFRNLHESQFRTHEPAAAHFFALPFSVLGLRMALGPSAVSPFVSQYLRETLAREWPYWNRSGGADHFYFTCHDIGVDAALKSPPLSASALQIVCPASRWKRNYIPTKDFSFPQIWPRYGSDPGGLSAAQRKASKQLAFWSGSQNSRVRRVLWDTWADDDEILLGGGRVLKQKARGEDYFANFRKSKYCLHVKGYQVHTARIGDAINFGCVPVILSDQFDLPFSDILDWREFAVIVAESQVVDLKAILKSVSDETYEKLHRNVGIVRRFFTWNSPPEDYDTFHMIMYELWLRRFIVRPLL